MIDQAAAMSAIGIVAGTATTILALAQLTCEHGASPWSQRVSTVLLGMIAAYTAIDSWEVWAGIDESLDSKAIAFCIALAMSWGYRRTFGVTSHRRTRPPVWANGVRRPTAAQPVSDRRSRRDL